MGTVVNLRSHRTKKARRDKAAAAAANRAAHGQPKTERAAQTAQRSAADRHLDGHRLDGASQPHDD